MQRPNARLRLVTPPSRPAEPTSPAGPLDLAPAFRRYSPYVAAVAVRLLGRDEDVDDVVQDVFLRAIRGLGQLRDPDAVKGWLATVTVRVARRKLRMRRLRSWLGLADTAEHETPIASGASAEQRALLSRVYAILESLPVDVRIAWTLRHVEGEKLESVARLCGCSLATAKRRIASAQQAMDEAFGDE